MTFLIIVVIVGAIWLVVASRPKREGALRAGGTRSQSEVGSIVNKRHTWTTGDDIVAFYLYRHGAAALPMRQVEIARFLGMSEASLIMRQGNFSSIDRGTGLRNVAQQSVGIYSRHRNASEIELRALALRALKRGN
jgi:hypothetical protein